MFRIIKQKLTIICSLLIGITLSPITKCRERISLAVDYRFRKNNFILMFILNVFILNSQFWSSFSIFLFPSNVFQKWRKVKKKDWKSFWCSQKRKVLGNRYQKQVLDRRYRTVFRINFFSSWNIKVKIQKPYQTTLIISSKLKNYEENVRHGALTYLFWLGLIESISSRFLL